MSVDVKRSEHNPFRTPNLTPNPTGASSTNAAAGPSQYWVPSLPQAEPPPRNPSPHPSPQHSQASPQASQETRQNSVDELAASLGSSGLDDNTPAEPPPAYSVTANPTQGEVAVDYGPTRPFQPAPPPPGQTPPYGYPQQHFTGPGPHFIGASSGPYPHPHFTGPPVGPPPGMPYTGPSPQHTGMGMPYMSPHPTGHIPPQPTGPWHVPGPSHSPYPSGPGGFAIGNPPLEARSEFARDFYDAGAGGRHDGMDERMRRGSPVPSSGSSEGTHGPESAEHSSRLGRNASTASASSYAPPHGPPPNRSTSSAYAPPQGPPPSLSIPFSPPPGPPPQHPARAPSLSQQDLTPTTTPTPGRPLLHDGRILIYPKGTMCKKCSNTGYKQSDPSHPCRRCWEKHSKAYSAAMAYAPRSEQSQRPLPNLRPPQHRHSQSYAGSTLAVAPDSGLQRSQSAYHHGSPPGVPSSFPPDPSQAGPGPGYPGGFAPPHNYNQPFSMPMPSVHPMYSHPPPGATVLQPGDSRIGGRICWRCNGKGTVSFMIFDVEKCHICQGVGRTFG